MNPNYRSSSVFPVYVNNDIKTNIIFLNYWKKKNNLSNVVFSTTLRDAEGNCLGTDSKKISEIPYASIYKVNDVYSSKLSKITKTGFQASIEVEVFFEEEPAIKYPALILNYSDNTNSSFVHSCLRSFNLDENLIAENTSKSQTGFNGFMKFDVENYLIFIGGNQKEYEFKISFEDSKNKVIKKVKLNNKNNKNLFNINLNKIIKNEHIDLDRAKISVTHDANDVFARFYVGNTEKNKIPTLTHTFFDEQHTNAPAILDNEKIFSEKNLYNASFSFPILDTNLYQTNLVSYSSNAIWEGKASIEILKGNGKKIFEKNYDVNKDFFLFKNTNMIINDFLDNNNIKTNINYTFKMSFQTDASKFPSRHKYGLNYSKNKFNTRGTNICFSPLVLSDYQFNKNRSITWGPIGGPENIIFIFNNTCIKKTNRTTNLIEIDFINSLGSTLTKKYVAAADECIQIDINKDTELKNHLKSEIGWCFCSTDNNFYNAWYISIGSENIGGDHCF